MKNFEKAINKIIAAEILAILAVIALACVGVFAVLGEG